MISCMRLSPLLFAALLITAIPAHAAVVEYDLTIEKRMVDITGKSVQGMTINGEIPGPVLRFKEGDTARIHVQNKMDVETSIHWHGVLVPPGMDGVPFVSFTPIAPGTTFTYEFPIRQSGTYWYHSHTDLQEQLGVYGAIVIEPLEGETQRADRDYTILFSDWTDEDPHEALRTLKRGGEWYAIRKGSGQSIFGAARLGMLGDYFSRELQRMPPMDISDVAYDLFLANGRPELNLDAGPGETVRIRVIDGSATTYFHLEFAGGPMTIISADGQEVEPVKENRVLISVAETYDVFIKVPASGAYEFRATAHDGSGHATVWIGSGERHYAPDVPRPNLYHAMGGLSLKRVFALTPAGTMDMSDDEVEAGRFDRPGMMHTDSMDREGMHDMKGMQHSDDYKMGDGDMMHEQGMNHPPSAARMSSGVRDYCADFLPLAADVSSFPNLAMDGMDPERPWPPYDRLRAVKSTTLPSDRPVREIRLTLDGDMERYVWFLNNKPLSESDSILIRQGKIVRFIMINRTMMHHPMHLHGHFFRVINGQGDYSPLKHTVDVAPMSTTVIEFDANELGDWFFHCHLLYHMKSGMARVVHYEGYNPDQAVVNIREGLYRDPWYFWGQADVLNNMTKGFLRMSDIRNIFTTQWESGWQMVDDLDWEGTLTWDRYVNRFFSVFAGADLLGMSDKLEDLRGVLGFRYLLPLNVETRAWVDSDRGARVTFDKVFQLTPRTALSGEAQYDTHDRWEGNAGLSYTVTRALSLLLQWHSEYGYGAGVTVRF